MLGMDPFEVTEADLAQTSREAKHSHPSLGEEYPSNSHLNKIN